MNFTIDKHISPNISQLFLSEFTIFVLNINHELDLSSTFFLFKFVMLPELTHRWENLAKFSYKWNIRIKNLSIVLYHWLPNEFTYIIAIWRLIIWLWKFENLGHCFIQEKLCDAHRWKSKFSSQNWQKFSQENHWSCFNLYTKCKC